MVIDTHLPCNAIIRRPLPHQISAVVSTKYLTMTFLTIKVVVIVKGNQKASREYVNTCLKGKKALLVNYPEIYNEKPEVRTKVAEELVEVCLGPTEKEVTRMGCTLDGQ